MLAILVQSCGVQVFTSQDFNSDHQLIAMQTAEITSSLDIVYKILYWTTEQTPESLLILASTCRAFRDMLKRYPSLWNRAGLCIMYGPLNCYIPLVYQSKNVPFLYMSASLAIPSALQCFINGGYSVDYQNIVTLATPLIVAAQLGELKHCKMLLNAGADIHLRDFEGHSALSKACSSGNLELCKYLISKGAQINMVTVTGSTLLHEACSGLGHFEIKRLLLDSGAEINLLPTRPDDPMHLAAATVCCKLVRLLASNGHNVNCKNHRGTSPLHIAALANSFEMCQELISLGAIIDAIDDTGSTALHMAVVQSNPLICKLLLQHGANPRHINKLGSSPLEDAAPENLFLDSAVSKSSNVWLFVLLFAVVIGHIAMNFY